MENLTETWIVFFFSPFNLQSRYLLLFSLGMGIDRDIIGMFETHKAICWSV